MNVGLIFLLFHAKKGKILNYNYYPFIYFLSTYSIDAKVGGGITKFNERAEDNKSPLEVDRVSNKMQSQTLLKSLMYNRMSSQSSRNSWTLRKTNDDQK